MVKTSTVRRNGTYARLLSSKRIGYIGAIALLFNAATGPGLPFTPKNFESPGYIFTICAFVLFAFISGFSILFIIEAMQAIPGNKHFQGNVEYATLINFYFKRKEHIIGQIMLYGALQSNAIQSIILSSQAIDNLLLDFFGKTCGLALSGQQKGWICVAKAGSLPSPFGETYMLCTLGFLTILFLVIPLGLTNVDDNIWVQYAAFGLSIAMIGQWVSAAFVTGLSFDRIRPAEPLGLSYGAFLGTVMLNLAITVIIPSWINIKDKDVNVQRTVWSSIGLITSFYLIPGIILAMGFSTDSDNILTVLLQQGVPKPLTKLTVYLFAFAMLLPAIPVNLLISKENLTQNKLVSNVTANVVCLLIPWLICIPLQTGNLIAPFQTWTSSIFVSFSNFIIPVLIYFKCKNFRRQYNSDRVLTKKQLELLKQIHSQSTRIVNHIGRKEESIPINPQDKSTINNETVNQTTGADMANIISDTSGDEPAPILATDDFNWIKDDVPDPDMEDYVKSMTLPRRSSGILERVSELTNTLGRFSTTKHKDNLSTILESHSDMKENSIGNTKNSPSYNYPKQDYIESTVRTIDRPFSENAPIDRLEDADDSSGLGRFKTLPINPQFKSPGFRSVPAWMPLRGIHMAWIVLITTSLVTIGNIAVNLMPLITV